MSRPTQAHIDLNAISLNYEIAQRLSAPGNALPIIKADAYGHGAIEVARHLSDQAPAFGVACIDEAQELRESGITNPILLLEGAYRAEEVKLSARLNFWVMVSNRSQADAICRTRTLNPLSVWLKIDTGMHRLGIPHGETTETHTRLQSAPHIQKVITLCTHFACADACGSDFTREQMRRFQQATANLPGPHSLANSAGLLAWPASRGDWNRPGYMLYGGQPLDKPTPEANQLKPAMRLTSEIISINRVEKGDSVGYSSLWTATRPSRIATIAIGYGDGYPRNAGNGTPVLINGQRAPLAGRVSMDMITVDITDLPEIKIGDPVVLWGEGLSIDEVAQHAATIGYELITRMPQRTPRIYQH